jgi:hypothetical protein
LSGADTENRGLVAKPREIPSVWNYLDSALCSRLRLKWAAGKCVVRPVDLADPVGEVDEQGEGVSARDCGSAEPSGPLFAVNMTLAPGTKDAVSGGVGPGRRSNVSSSSTQTVSSRCLKPGMISTSLTRRSTTSPDKTASDRGPTGRDEYHGQDRTGRGVVAGRIHPAHRSDQSVPDQCPLHFPGVKLGGFN